MTRLRFPVLVLVITAVSVKASLTAATPFPDDWAPNGFVLFRTGGGGASPQWGRKSGEVNFIAADNRFMVTTATTGLADQRRTIEFGTPKPLFARPLPQGVEYDTVRDGDRFLLMMPTEESPPIVVLTNWAPTGR